MINKYNENKHLVKKTFSLALPAITDMFVQMLFGIIDMSMVGKLGAFAIAAIGLANSPMMTIASLFTAASVGATALVAREIGAKNPKEANKIASQAILINIIIAFFCTILVLFTAKPIISLMGADKDTLIPGTNYLLIASLGLVFISINFVIAGILRGAGDTKTPMKINAFSLILNLIFNFICIFPTREIFLEMPFDLSINFTMFGLNMGVAGAAFGTLLSRIVAGAFLCILLLSDKLVISISLKNIFKSDIKTLKRILNIGIPAAIEQFFMRSGQLLYMRVIASLGTVMLAAHRITLTAESLSFYVGYGFALAGTTLVGQNLGAKEPKTAEKSGHIAALMAILFMSIMGILFFFFPEPLIKLFSDDPVIIKAATPCLKLVAFSQPFLAANMAYAGGLRGAGDTRTVLIITFIGIWGLRLIGAIVSVQLGFGLLGAWFAMCIDQIGRSNLLFYRFKKGNWKNLKV